MMHGSLYLFSNYMGYHSTLPFGYTKNRVIPFKVRMGPQMDLVSVKWDFHLASAIS